MSKKSAGVIFVATLCAFLVSLGGLAYANPELDIVKKAANAMLVSDVPAEGADSADGESAESADDVTAGEGASGGKDATGAEEPSGEGSVQPPGGPTVEEVAASADATDDKDVAANPGAPAGEDVTSSAGAPGEPAAVPSAPQQDYSASEITPSDYGFPFPFPGMEPAASIGDTTYDTIAAAFNAVLDGEKTTITLLKDVVLNTSGQSAQLFPGREAVFDMNGFSITVGPGFSGRPILNYGNLTVLGNGTIDSSASVGGGYGAIDTKENATLTVMNGTFKGNPNAGGSAIKVRPDASATIYDGEFSGTCAVYNEGSMGIFGGDYDTRSCNECTNYCDYAIYSLGSASLTLAPSSNDALKVHGIHGALQYLVILRQE